jgi:predicted glutamine amidotransferase
MCRLMAFVSAQTRDFPSVVGEDFSEFIALSSFHKDGWGIAINNAHKSQVLISRAPEQASNSAQFRDRVGDLHGDGGLLHLRWATSGLQNCDENTHPFIHGQFSFIHNGDIRPRENLDKFIKPELNKIRTGETDSERYFYLLLTEIEKHGIVEGVKSAIAIIESVCTFSSINAMLLTPENLIVISKFNADRIPNGQPEDYYELRYKLADRTFLIASSGWHQDPTTWHPLANGTLMVINRSSVISAQDIEQYLL